MQDDILVSSGWLPSLILDSWVVTCIHIHTYLRTYVHKRVFAKRIKCKKVTMCRDVSYNWIQTSSFSVSALTQEMSGLTVTVQVAHRSTMGVGGHEASVSESVVCAWQKRHSCLPKTGSSSVAVVVMSLFVAAIIRIRLHCVFVYFLCPVRAPGP